MQGLGICQGCKTVCVVTLEIHGILNILGSKYAKVFNVSGV